MRSAAPFLRVRGGVFVGLCILANGSMQLFVNALIAGSLASLIAGGLALVYGVFGVFNLALGQTVLIGGYTAWWFVQVAGLPLLVAIPAGLCVGGLLAWLTFELCIRPFYRYHRFLPIVTTMAWGMMLDAFILVVFQEPPRTILSGVKQSLGFNDITLNEPQAVLILVTFLLLGLFAWALHATRFGRQVRAVVSHEHAAVSLGIPAALLNRVLFIASGVLAAMGGIFVGIDQNLTPTLAFPLTIKAYAAIIAGGKGNVWGAVLCAFGIALLEQLAVGVHWFGMFYVPAGYQGAVALLVIIVFLLLRPQGIFGSSRRFA